MRAAVPMSYCRAKATKPTPKATNMTPDQKSFVFLNFIWLVARRSIDPRA
jgi:hypothetical protein